MKKPAKKKAKFKPVKHASRLMKDIEAFHKKFGRKAARQPALLSVAEFEFRLKFLQEELDELVKGYAANDLAEFADGLVDLVYVAMGAAYLANIPFDKVWAAVHKANMKKKKAKAAADSARGYIFDIVKPKGWQKPDVAKVLQQHGAKPSMPRPAQLDHFIIKTEDNLTTTTIN